MPTLKYRDPGDGQWKYLLATVPTGDPDTGWIDLPFVNSWRSYGGNWSTGQYRKVNGIVYLKGLITAGSPVTSVIATLPAGFRPEADRIFVCGIQVINTGAATAGTAHTHPVSDTAVRFQVMANGDIAIGHTLATNGYVDVSTVSFPVNEIVPTAMSNGGGAVPPGGIKGQSLRKNSTTDYDSLWTGDTFGVVYKNGNQTSASVGTVWITDCVAGAMTNGFTANANGLILPVTGYYEFHAQARLSATGAAANTGITIDIVSVAWFNITASGQNISPSTHGIQSFTAGTVVRFGWLNAVANIITCYGGASYTFMTARLLWPV